MSELLFEWIYAFVLIGIGIVIGWFFTKYVHVVDRNKNDE